MQPLPITCPDCGGRMDYKARRCETCAAAEERLTLLLAERRKTRAAIGEEIVVPMKITCPDCGGRMDYKARRCETCAAAEERLTLLLAERRKTRAAIGKEFLQDAICDQRRAMLAARQPRRPSRVWWWMEQFSLAILMGLAAAAAWALVTVL